MEEGSSNAPDPEAAEGNPEHPPQEAAGQPQYPTYYPPPHPVKSSIDTATFALILAAAGLIYWCPPFVLPGVALYLASKAQKEIASGQTVDANAPTFIKVARVLAIVGIVIGGLSIMFFIATFVLGALFGH
jgi:hypothetical protein